MKVGNNAYPVDVSRDPQEQSGPSKSIVNNQSPTKGVDTEDPLAKTLAELNNAVSTQGSARRNSMWRHHKMFSSPNPAQPVLLSGHLVLHRHSVDLHDKQLLLRRPGLEVPPPRPLVIIAICGHGCGRSSHRVAARVSQSQSFEPPNSRVHETQKFPRPCRDGSHQERAHGLSPVSSGERNLSVAVGASTRLHLHLRPSISSRSRISGDRLA